MGFGVGLSAAQLNTWINSFIGSNMVIRLIGITLALGLIVAVVQALKAGAMELTKPLAKKRPRSTSTNKGIAWSDDGLDEFAEWRGLQGMGGQNRAGASIVEDEEEGSAGSADETEFAERVRQSGRRA